MEEGAETVPLASLVAVSNTALAVQTNLVGAGYSEVALHCR